MDEDNLQDWKEVLREFMQAATRGNVLEGKDLEQYHEMDNLATHAAPETLQ